MSDDGAGRNPPAPRLTVLLPAYNEEPNVEEALKRCDAALRALGQTYEILLIDDGSQDGTAAVAEHLRDEIPSLRIIRNPLNLGVGISLLTGMRAAAGDLVLHDAMDYPFDLADLERVLPLFPESDIVVVVRKSREAHSPYRKLTSLVHHWLVRLLFLVPFRDMNFVQVYKREVLQELIVKAKSPAFVTPELLIRARDQGFRVVEMEATFHRRHKGQANYGKPRDILWTLADMLSFWIERTRGRA